MRKYNKSFKIIIEQDGEKRSKLITNVNDIDLVIHVLTTIKSKMIEDRIDMEIIKNINKIKNDNT